MDRKRTLGLFLLVAGLTLITAGFAFARSPEGSPALPRTVDAPWAGDAIRLHIVANSDSAADQALKRAVRDAILQEVTPLFESALSAAEAEALIARALPRIEAVAAAVVAASASAYSVRAEVGEFEFPARAYGPVFLPAGRYRALRVVLGEAKGANWWCILFPPMCFVDWSMGIVLEPKPGSGGAETVAVSRREAVALIDEEALARAPVKGRSALLDWVRRRQDPPKGPAGTKSAPPQSGVPGATRSRR